MKKNKYKEVEIEGMPCIEFISGGKNQLRVLVDKEIWYSDLQNLHWTAIKKGKNVTIKSSKDKHSVRLHRVIIEKKYLEIDYWGNTIDHINNDTLDNRLVNLRIYNSKLNATNIKSKFSSDNDHLIHKQPSGGYKVHTNIFDETIYRHFKTKEEAREYRDKEVIPYIEKRIMEMKKKTRDVEFERGLRDKLAEGEREEVLTILREYEILD